MSVFAMNTTEEKQIDSQIEQMMDWAKSRRAEAEQLALDSTRLMACTTDRIDRLKNQGFFKRCWNRFTGKTGEIERANASDIIQMQKVAFRYVNMLQEQQLLMAHSLLSLKNNLVSLAIKEEETRNLIALLADKTRDRFEKLEGRVDQLEISTNLQGWLLGLEERDYDEKYPTEYMRLFRVINDFYQIKNDNWNYNDLMFMRKAIRTVDLNPKQKISLNVFINTLTDEIQNSEIGFDEFDKSITLFKPEGIENYSKFVIDNISSPVFVSIHGLKTQYVDRLDIVETLEDEMNISKGEALKLLLRRSIGNMNVNLNYEFPLAETAIEILGCLRLSEQLVNQNDKDIHNVDNSIEISSDVQDEEQKRSSYIQVVSEDFIDLNNVTFSDWKRSKKGCKREEVRSIIHGNTNFYVLDGPRIYKTHNILSHEGWESIDNTYGINQLLYVNKRMIAIAGSKVFSMNNQMQLFELETPHELSEVRVLNYNKIFSFNGNLCFWARTDHDFLYIKNNEYSRLFNFNETLNIINLKSIEIFGNTIVALATSGNEAFILLSTDGVTWDKVKCDSSFEHICNCNNQCFIIAPNSLYNLDISSGLYTDSGINIDSKESFHKPLRLISYPRYGIIFRIVNFKEVVRDTGNKYCFGVKVLEKDMDRAFAIFATNDMNTWKNITGLIEYPFHFCFSGREIVAFCWHHVTKDRIHVKTIEKHY